MGTMAYYSRHLIEGNPTEIRAQSETADHRQAELTAMRAISEALEPLKDDETRARVLTWASETFGLKAAARPSAARASSPGPEALNGDRDLSLSESDLESFFVAREPASPEPVPAGPQDEAQPVVSMIHGFVADVQQLARDWQGAETGPAPVAVTGPAGPPRR